MSTANETNEMPWIPSQTNNHFLLSGRDRALQKDIRIVFAEEVDAQRTAGALLLTQLDSSSSVFGGDNTRFTDVKVESLPYYGVGELALDLTPYAAVLNVSTAQ